MLRREKLLMFTTPYTANMMNIMVAEERSFDPRTLHPQDATRGIRVNFIFIFFHVIL